MPDDGGEDDVIITSRPGRRKVESKLGNFIECVLTYGSGFFIYLPVNAVLIFGPWEFATPEARAYLWQLWIPFTFLYYAANAYAANVGTQARFTSKTFRFFFDFGASASPLILPVLMVLFTITGTYRATQMDVLVSIYMSAFCLLELISHSNLVQTGIRRVREGTLDR